MSLRRRNLGLAVCVAMMLVSGTANSANGGVPNPGRNPVRPVPVAPPSLVAGDAEHGRLDLRAGPLEARIENSGHGTKVRAGESAFIDLVLTNVSDRRIRDARVLVVGNGVRLLRAQGQGVRSRRAGDGHVITVGRLGPGAGKTIVIEIQLRGTASGTSSGDGLRATMRLAVKAGPAATAPTGSTGLSWTVFDPARDYHRALAKIHASTNAGMHTSIRKARSGKRALPGKWLFKRVRRVPKRSFRTIEKQVTQRYCKGYRRATRAERRLARRRGRRIRRLCTGRATRTVVRKVRVRVKEKSTVVGKQELRVIELAHNAVRSRGAAPLMRIRGGRYGWTVTRLAADLEAYLTQAPNPALCVNMGGYFSYLTAQTVGFKVRATDMHAARELAPALAARHVETVRDRLRNAPGGHPAWGGAPLAILTPFPDDADVLMSLPQIAGHLITLTVSQEEGGTVAATTDVLKAFRRAATALRRPEFAAQSPVVRRATRRALTMLEASHYLAMGDGHYVRVEKALYGSFDLIRKAHAEKCVPGS